MGGTWTAKVRTGSELRNAAEGPEKEDVVVE